MRNRNIAFIGAGNMSAAIISGLVNAGYPSQQIMASNPSRPKLDNLKDKHNIKITQDNHQAIAESDVIVLAVKPQLMEQVCQDIQQQSLESKLFVSIAAGINSDRLVEMLGGNVPVVRTMPNTPSLLSKGMTGLFAPDNISDDDKSFIFDMMSCVGDAAWVEKESDIDLVIATAGSSPAYFFLFLEAMQNHAIKNGMDRDTSRKLVQQAMLGAAEMVCHNDHLELSELRAQVTSKGGTTNQAIESFQQSGLEGIVEKAMDAAVSRAQEMAKMF